MQRMLATALAEDGYLEKKTNYLLDSKEENAGKNNFTKYWRDLSPSSQGNAWCQCFVDWVFEKTYGREVAKKLLCHDEKAWSFYTPTCSNYFKSKSQWRDTPQAGDVIYFQGNAKTYYTDSNGKSCSKTTFRIKHVGIVTKVDDTYVYTIEGNTSSKSGVVANGGGVVQKSYKLTSTYIAGYGRPDYSIVKKQAYVIGWNSDEKGWWYADTESTYYKSTWQVINNHWYYFNADGYAVKGIQTIDGAMYYFVENGELECALCVTSEKGELYALEAV